MWTESAHLSILTSNQNDVINDIRKPGQAYIKLTKTWTIPG